MAGIREAELATIIDRFYEAAVQPELWRAVLHEMSELCGADGALIIGQPASIGISWSEGVDEAVDAMIQTGWHLRNERMQRANRLSRSGHTLITESMAFDQKELDHHPFNAEFVNPQGMRWYMGMLLADEGDATVALSIERQARRDRFSKGELHHLATLSPHLRRATSLALKFGLARAEGMLETFDRIACGALLLNGLGRVIRLNKEAESHLGVSIRLERGCLRAACKDADHDLQRLIASVIAPRPSHTVDAVGPVALPRAGLPVIAHAAPIVGSAQDVFQRTKAIITLVDPNRRRLPNGDIAKSIFGLTAAEAKIAVLIGSGLTPRNAAARLGITEETARSTLKRVYAKTGVARQSELTALFNRLVLP